MQLQVDLLKQITESSASTATCGHELRQHARTRLIGHAMIIPCPSRVERRAVPAIVTDLSANGIGVVLPMQLHCGEKFIVRLPSSSPSAARAVVCTVVQSRYAGGGYATGATFTRILEPQGADGCGSQAEAPLLPAAALANDLREDTFAQLTEEGREHLRQLERRLGQIH